MKQDKRSEARHDQGVERTPRGEDQPRDKKGAQQHSGQNTDEPQDKGVREQQEAARQQPPSPGEPAGGE